MKGGDKFVSRQIDGKGIGVVSIKPIKSSNTCYDIWQQVGIKPKYSFSDNSGDINGH